MSVKVSVAMITYNHERFVAQAIESALEQEVDFEYEIVIGEDRSTDNTREIVFEFQRRRPDRIRLLLRENNLGMIQNFVQTLQACCGEYVAILESDDFWTSSLKLQKQVEFLDSHPECAICFHNVTMMYEDGSEEPYCSQNQKTISTLKDLLLSNFIPNCSVMFRRGLFGEFPAWYYSMGMGDRPLHILNAQHGAIGYIDEVLGTYRVHSGGVWSAQSHDRGLREEFHMYEAVNAHLGFKYDHIVAIAKRESVCYFLVERGKTASSIEEGTALAFQTCEQWQADLGIPKDWKAKAMGRVYAYYLFSSYKDCDFPAVRHCFFRLARYDPSWLCNPGVWSIGVEAFLGRRVADLLRRSARKVLRLSASQVSIQ